ncbi:MAG: DUF1572 domain-containing protein [Anaerolineales bacterium]|nr:DUF1572 domain-containing protein [Anaerolineales bacterium]
MQSFFADYLNLLRKCHDDIRKTMDGLPPEALDWTPGANMNSICVLVYHITGAERFWIGDVAAQEPSNRDRDAEFRVKIWAMNSCASGSLTVLHMQQPNWNNSPCKTSKRSARHRAGRSPSAGPCCTRSNIPTCILVICRSRVNFGISADKWMIFPIARLSSFKLSRHGTASRTTGNINR